MAEEQIFDFSTAVDLGDRLGERYIGWYMFKTPLRKESIPLNYKDTELEYQFNVCDYNCRFVMPPELVFMEGKINYNEGERILGVFRFPRDGDGKFAAPDPMTQQELDEMMALPAKELQKVLSAKKPLTFNSYKIEQYGFEMFDVSDFNIKELNKITDPEFTAQIKVEHGKVIDNKLAEIQEKILSKPNYLLILKNVLNRQWKNLSDLAAATDKIIHI